jgi:hypothetical protein
MSDVTRRNRSNKRKGAAFEVQITNHLNESGLDAERVAKKGNRDIGDVVLRRDRRAYVLECKNTVRASLPDWLRQAEVEAAQYAEHRRLDPESVFPVVIFKRRGASVEKSYVVMELDQWLRQVT